MVTFGERLKKERIEKDITLDKLAKDLGTTKATLSRYENNLREPKIDFIKSVADYFDVSTDYLLGRTEDKNTVIIKETIKGHDIEIGIDKQKYPYGLTYEQVVEILKNLNSIGFEYNPKDEN